MHGHVLSPREASKVTEVIMQAVPVVMVDDVLRWHEAVGFLPYQDGPRHPPVRLGDFHPCTLVPAAPAPVADTDGPHGGFVDRRYAWLKLCTRRAADALRCRVQGAFLERCESDAAVRAEPRPFCLGPFAVERFAAYLAGQSRPRPALGRGRFSECFPLARPGTEQLAARRLSESIRPRHEEHAAVRAGYFDWHNAESSSGTTLRMALGNGRSSIGIDLDERNADLALERVGPMYLEVEHAGVIS